VHGQTLDSAASPGAALLRVAGVGLATTAAVFVAGGGDAFWLCLPGTLLVSAGCVTRGGAAVSAAAIVATAGAALLASPGRASPPSLPLALLVPAACVVVLLALRERFERERLALRASALSDPLTGVANRRALLARIEYEIARHRRGRRTFALVMLDLDGFKVLNDRFGHPTGDELLRDVAGALSRAMRDQDTVARIGGDEFCILAPETDAAGARRLTARCVDAVADVTVGIDVLGASAGAALFPEDGGRASDLLQAADQRLLGAKRQVHRGQVGRRAA
jgi:diguanylate cyclase (GGDEF)-like protein